MHIHVVWFLRRHTMVRSSERPSYRSMPAEGSIAAFARSALFIVVHAENLERAFEQRRAGILTTKPSIEQYISRVSHEPSLIESPCAMRDRKYLPRVVGVELGFARRTIAPTA